MTETITANRISKQKPMVGTYFLKFCGKHNLQKLSEQSQTYSEIFSSGYQG
jgi:hypothetical protein